MGVGGSSGAHAMDGQSGDGAREGETLGKGGSHARRDDSGPVEHRGGEVVGGERLVDANGHAVLARAAGAGEGSPCGTFVLAVGFPSLADLVKVWGARDVRGATVSSALAAPIRSGALG